MYTLYKIDVIQRYISNFGFLILVFLKRALPQNVPQTFLHHVSTTPEKQNFELHAGW